MIKITIIDLKPCKAGFTWFIQLRYFGKFVEAIFLTILKSSPKYFESISRNCGPSTYCNNIKTINTNDNESNFLGLV